MINFMAALNSIFVTLHVGVITVLVMKGHALRDQSVSPRMTFGKPSLVGQNYDCAGFQARLFFESFVCLCFLR